MKPQVDKDIYFGSQYLSPARLACYSYHLKEIIDCQPKNILEIGMGSGLVSYILKKKHYDLTTLDFEKALEPDITASVTDIPLPDNAAEVVACFQVMEHLPFDQFVIALKEIHRVAGKCAVISLPDSGRIYQIEIRAGKIGKHRFSLEIPRIKNPVFHFDGEHYWEINRKGYPLKKVLKIIESLGFTVLKTYRIWEAPRQRVFVLKKNKIV